MKHLCFPHKKGNVYLVAPFSKEKGETMNVVFRNMAEKILI
jgi:hypothetical protein